MAELRPELHRYCARLTGSIVDGEDVVQDTLAKAYYAISMAAELPPLRPFLFRIAHNTAMDVLRRYERRHVDVVAEPPEDAAVGEWADPEVVRAALATFLELPIAQRSAVILKDVLGCSLDEIVEITGATLPAVKAALFRGRASLRARAGDAAAEPPRSGRRRRRRSGAPQPLRGALQRARLGRAARLHRRGLRGWIWSRATSGAAAASANTSRATPICATFASSPACSTTRSPAGGSRWRCTRRVPARSRRPSCSSNGAVSGCR